MCDSIRKRPRLNFGLRAQFFRKIIFEVKNRSWEPLAAKINFFEKFDDDVIITLNDQNWREISKFNEFNQICIRKGKINMPMLSLSKIDPFLTIGKTLVSCPSDEKCWNRLFDNDKSPHVVRIHENTQNHS